MPYACVVLGCSNRSNRENGKGFYRVPRETIKKGDRAKDFTQRRRKKWLLNLSLRSKGAESKHARVCSDHFVKGSPSNLYDDDNVDWAPTKNLGHDKLKEPSDECEKCDDRTRSREEKRKRSEGAEALLQFQKLTRIETPEPQEIQEDKYIDVAINNVHDVACQTEMTLDNVALMEDELKRLNSELCMLKSKALDTAL